MLAYDPKIENNGAGDQAILSLVRAVCEQAGLFYQRAAHLVSDNNIRRAYSELQFLHQQTLQLAVADNVKVATDPDINSVCQWYRQQNANLSAGENSWMAEVPQQLHRQLTAFKRLSRELNQAENAKALAHLTAGLQILTDQLRPLLLNRKK